MRRIAGEPVNGPERFRGLYDQLSDRLADIKALRAGPFAGQPISSAANVLALAPGGVSVSNVGRTQWVFRALTISAEAFDDPGAALDAWVVIAEKRLKLWRRRLKGTEFEVPADL